MLWLLLGEAGDIVSCLSLAAVLWLPASLGRYKAMLAFLAEQTAAGDRGTHPQ